MKILGVAASLLFFAGLAQAADLPPPVVTPVTRTNTTITGQHFVVPAKPDVIVATAVFAPGARLPVHKHLYPHYVYVLDGTLTIVNVETGKITQMKQGAFFVEMIDTWHYGENKQTTPLKLLAIDQVPPGTKSNVVVKP